MAALADETMVGMTETEMRTAIAVLQHLAFEVYEMGSPGQLTLVEAMRLVEAELGDDDR